MISNEKEKEIFINYCLDLGNLVKLLNKKLITVEEFEKINEKLSSSVKEMGCNLVKNSV